LSGHGAYKSPSAVKISALPDPQGGDMGGQKFLSPLPPQNLLVRPPQNYVIMLAFVSPTNPENLVKGWWPVFFQWPIWKYGTPVWAIHVNILESGVNSWYSFTWWEWYRNRATPLNWTMVAW